MYAKSKVQNEIDIKKSKNDYVILRLGSVYGYSLDTMRINIMPNLFSKLLLKMVPSNSFLRKTIKKSCDLIDVVRDVKFVEENSKLKENFPFIKEQTTVKKLLKYAKK